MNGLMRRSKRHLYSITLSARPSSEGGTARPSALAVLRLTISSDFVGACTHLGLPYESHRLQAPDRKRFHVGGTAMIRATVLRALVLTAACAARLAPVTCPGENSNQLPAQA